MQARWAILLLLFIVVPAASQDRSQLRNLVQPFRPPSASELSEMKEVLHVVEEAIERSDAVSVGSQCAPTIQFTLPSVSAKSYSSNQAMQLLGRFLSGQKVAHFRFDRRELAVASPYASGRVILHNSGRVDSLDCYVGLARSSDGWHVTQLSFF